jgi:hypothetical protein
MTGYQSKKTAALDEDGMYLVHHTAQQDATMQSLKDLKRSVCDELGKAAFAQPAQEPPPWWPAVENILTEYGLQAIDFVADFKEAMKDAPQRPWVDLTPQDLNEIFGVAMTGEGAVHLALEKIKEKNT